MYEDDRVIFDEDNQIRKNVDIYFDETPTVVKFVIKNSGGLIKNKKQAYVVLYSFITISLIITFSKIFLKSNNNELTHAQKIQIQEIEQMQKLNK